MTDTALKVTSHVSRDLLQSAQLFQHEHSVVWEYVSNGLEYVDPGTSPTVDVTVDVKGRRIEVRDNGRGMSAADLARYFTMHGENIDRKKGRAGRGMFGTGKSAAFGIGDTLRLTTVHNGKRSKVQLDRKDIEAATDGSEIPLQTLETEVPTTEPNGTLIEVEAIHLKKMDVASIIRHIERHIAHWPNASVVVNHQPCKVTEPAYSEERKVSTKGTLFEAILGDVTMSVKIAKAPLDQEWQGIAILSNTVWHTTTLAGCEGKLFANYIFGELDVPRLAQDKSPIPPFDMSRSMRLNLKNEIVQQIYAFVGSQVEIVRRELEKADKDRRKAKDAQKLLEEASAIAKIINQDFDAWRNQIQKTLAKTPGGADKLARAATGNGEGGTLMQGDEIPAILVDDADTTPGEYTPDDEPNDNPDPPPPFEAPSPGLEKGPEDSPIKAKPRKKRTGTAGGFNVDFRNMGAEEARAKYERDGRTIYINLDHPQIAAAQAIGGIDDIAFRRLSYEVAFSEYAIAVASEMASGDWYQDVTDPIVDIRLTIDRVSRSAAALYAKA
jgi:Histidine kinase-, DNA gyrase B-, and HSP90-like ATPase